MLKRLFEKDTVQLTNTPKRDYIEELHKQIDLQEQLMGDIPRDVYKDIEDSTDDSQPGLGILDDPEILQQLKQLEEEQNIKEVVEDKTRDAALNEEEKKLNTVYEDFLQLNSMMTYIREVIVSQGEDIQTIDNNISTAEGSTDAGIDELEKAEAHQIKSTWRRMKVLGGAVVGGALFGGVGSMFGVAQAFVAGGVGGSTGAITGYFVS